MGITQSHGLKVHKPASRFVRMDETIGSLVRRRLSSLPTPLTEYQFASRIPMNSGYVSLVLSGAQALPDKWIARWADILQWPQGTAEYDRFVEVVKLSRAKSYKHVGATVRDLEEKVKELQQQLKSEALRADANQARSDELALQIKTLGEQLATLRRAIAELTGGTGP